MVCRVHGKAPWAPRRGRGERYEVRLFPGRVEGMDKDRFDVLALAGSPIQTLPGRVSHSRFGKRKIEMGFDRTIILRELIPSAHARLGSSQMGALDSLVFLFFLAEVLQRRFIA